MNYFLPFFLRGITLGFSAGITPGPLFAYLFSEALRKGWRKTLPAAFAPLVSDGPIVLIVLVLLKNTPDSILHGLKIVGGIYIIYLAYNLFRSVRANVPSSSIPQSHNSLFQATLMNLLNPNPYLFWSTILGPILIDGWNISPGIGILFISSFYLAMISTFFVLIFIFASSGKINRKLNQSLLAIASIALFIFGVSQIYQGVFLYYLE